MVDGTENHQENPTGFPTILQVWPVQGNQSNFYPETRFEMDLDFQFHPNMPAYSHIHQK